MQLGAAPTCGSRHQAPFGHTVHSRTPRGPDLVYLYIS